MPEGIQRPEEDEEALWHGTLPRPGGVRMVDYILYSVGFIVVWVINFSLVQIMVGKFISLTK